MNELIKKIHNLKPDTVFVGGVSEMVQGKRNTTRDIDICVTNLDGLESLGNIKKWVTDSKTSISGKRAGIEGKKYIIDIFVEDKLPDYIEIEGIKYQTIPSLIKEYERVIKEMESTDRIPSINKMKIKLHNLKLK
jgi:hypothetical protein